MLHEPPFSSLMLPFVLLNVTSSDKVAVAPDGNAPIDMEAVRVSPL